MTDARFPERWLNDRRVLRLSDPSFRLFVISLTWSVANRTDGVLYDDDLALMVNVDPARAVEMIKAGLWRRDADRYVIVEFDGTQTPATQLDGLAQRRRSDRGRSRRYRERKALSREKSRDDKGQARPGRNPRPEERTYEEQEQRARERETDDRDDRS